FQGVYHRQNKRVLVFERTAKNATKAPVKVSGIDDPKLDEMLGADAVAELRSAIELLEGAGDGWDRRRFLAGEISPVFFGSALTNFGVEPFLEDFADICPPPGPRETSEGVIEPGDERFTAFVFKVQANMDPAHRDRVAFMRIVSGKFESGMRVWHYRLGKQIRLARAEQLFADERQTVHEAWAGDIVGLHDPGLYRIGDTLASDKPVTFDSVPRFSPEHFARLRLVDPMKRKQMQKGLSELAEEGTVQLFFEPGREKDPILGVVGQLQFEVLTYRLENEYGAKVALDRLGYSFARWVDEVRSPKELTDRRVPLGVTDVDGRPVALLRDRWELERIQRDNAQWTFRETAPITLGGGPAS
ncbi:MAG TPA: EF-Tu/IF-2/RF-3 family GTPase, partial [Sandaracinaceae bacterium]